MEIDLDGLRRLAEEAIVYEERCANDEQFRVTGCVVRAMHERSCNEDFEYDSHFASDRLMNAIDGRVILELLDRLRSAERERDELQAQLRAARSQERNAYLLALRESGMISAADYDVLLNKHPIVP